MAKKTATAKKSTAVKAKVTKPSKPQKEAKSVAKPQKMVEKSKVKSPKVQATAKAVEAKKPALMTKRGKKSEEKVEVSVEKKSQTIVSMIESTATVDDSSGKAEKVGKFKPIKIERGNLADEKAKWSELNKKFGKDKALPYKMTESYPSLVPIQHKVLGWGFILTNENNRLEVLFENGIRMLISNYKA